MSFHPTSLTRLSASVLVLWAMALPIAIASNLPSELAPIPIEQWQPIAGDSFVVDTQQNIGYLLHPDGGYTSFPVVTGQRRTVRYIGRVYDATTPVRTWTVLSQEVKGDRITFGKQGRFLRMFKDGDDRTPYGIHSHAYAQKMLSGDDRYRSMGCVIVSDDMLDLIMKTMELNEKELNVVTVYGFGEEMVTAPLLQAVLTHTEKESL